MKSKKEIQRKKRKNQQKANIEKKNLQKIQEIKNEDFVKRTKKKAKRARERTNSQNIKSNVKNAKSNERNKIAKNTTKEKKQVNNNTKNNIKNGRAKDKRKNREVSYREVSVLKKLNYIVWIASIIVISILIYLALRPKFKDVTIELGTTEITANEFLVSEMYQNGVEAVTDFDSLDLTSVQEIDIVLSFKGKEETVKLNIVDTTAPVVELQDVHQYLDYEINPEDFVKSKEDYSEMTVEIINDVEFTDYGTYSVTIKVSDAYGNETIGECNLVITWLLYDVNIELGSEFSVADIVIDPERFGALVPETELAKVNTMVLGTYELYVEIEGKTYTSTVIVQDTTPPDLQLQNISIWNDEKVSGYESFIVSASDISGEVTTECLSTIDYSIIGNQDIVIKATDVNGNSVEQTAVLTIKKDTTGPVIYGLSNLTVNKNSSVNYESGVYATDDKDGSVSFSYDSSAVNTSAAGTYYATYTSKDAAGNTTTSKRKITVNWDYSDVTAKINEFYNNYCVGLSAEGITSVVKSRIKYSSVDYGGGNSAVYYGLTNGTGNCYVHASILHHLLTKAGYSDKIVYLNNYAHYWNYCNGVHYDSTPSNNHSLVAYSNEEKASGTYMVSHGYTVDNFVF